MKSFDDLYEEWQGKDTRLANSCHPVHDSEIKHWKKQSNDYYELLQISRKETFKEEQKVDRLVNYIVEEKQLCVYEDCPDDKECKPCKRVFLRDKLLKPLEKGGE